MHAPGGRIVRRTIVPAVAALAALALGPAAPAAHAGFPVIWQFPDGCNGTKTLQACINQASDGDAIQLVTNSPIDERPTIFRSLTLEAGSGFAPTITNGLEVDGNSGSIDVRVARVTFGADVDVELGGGSGHSIVLDHVEASTNVTQPAVMLNAVVPADLEVTGGTFRLSADDTQQPGIELLAQNDAGTVTFRATGNRIDGHAAGDGGAGVVVWTLGEGAASARVMGNSVWRVATCNCGRMAGLTVQLQGTGHTDVDLVGNTVERSRTNGASVSNLMDSGGTASVDVFDDVFSHLTGSAVAIDDSGAGALAFHEGFNDRFAAGSPDVLDGFHEGAGDLTATPGYVDAAAGDLRLKPSSALVDAGVVCSPGGVAAIDAAGRFRLAGPTVDIGAYERGAPPLTGDAFVGNAGNDAHTGTSGADILCGMGGSDALNGAGGDDYVDGGPAGDALQGGTGVDTVEGRAGPDQLFGNEGADTLVGGAGPDTLSGGPGNDPCIDSRDGRHGNDHVDGGTGRDGFVGDPGDEASNVEHPAVCG